ncbi:hypothetical protein NQ314_011610 [Rhamnusium bicolor]|uniref:C2H2-type domain-containing protein n=1 Tax=Rhamnusium bicolor TaxID=1586634 RepID=A0AAV8XHM9_9CUCU|nr:hypothetical protein NQ314_011610 [Rhamnusium bicolor]
MEQLVKDLALLDLPSTMWGVHVHPENKFIGILHINVSSNKLIIDKGLLVEENDGLKARIILNGFSMYLPNVALGLKLISDISALLHTLHNKTVCINSNDGERYPECLKLIDNNNDVEEDITYCCMCRPANLEGKVLVISDISTKCCLSYQHLKIFKKFLASAETLKFVYHELKPYNPNEETPGIDPNGLGEYKPTCSVYNQELSSEMDLTVHNEQYNKIKSEECPSKPKKGEKNNKEKQVLCNVCGKILAPGYRIEEHMLTHTLVKPFQCKICAKTFAKSHNLRMHEHTHSDVSYH